MGKTIRARFSKGVIIPLEKIELEEGKEIMVTILDLSECSPKEDPLDASAGAWKDLIDCDELIKNIYESRRIATRPEPKL